MRQNNPILYRDLVRRIGRVKKNAADYAVALEKQYVAAGWMGRKSGRGFYKYDA
jgi:3-hydroxyacyl-CoA dehydrogenase